MTEPNVYDTAAQVLKEHGRVRGSLMHVSATAAERPVCLVGALALARGMPEDELAGYLSGSTSSFGTMDDWLTRNGFLSSNEAGSLYDSLAGAEATATLSSILKEQYPDRIMARERGLHVNALFEFNDDSHTTDDDVLAVLEKASIQHDEKVTP